MLRRLHSSNLQSAFQHRIEVPISYSGLFVRVTGTNDAGQTATLRQLGRVRYSIRQQSIIDADWDFLAQTVQLWGGTFEFASAVGAGFSASIFIPRSFIGDKNVERVVKADSALFEMQFTPALFAALADPGFLIELYAVPEEGPQAYNMTMLQQTYPSVGASSVYVDDIALNENVMAAYLSDVVGGVLTLAGGNLNTARVRKGDLVFDAFVSALQAATIQKYKVEGGTATTQPIVELFGLTGSDLSARLDDLFNLTVETTAGGAATPQILTIGAKFNPQRLAESRDERDERLRRARTMAAQSNKTRKLAVVDSLTRSGV